MLRKPDIFTRHWHFWWSALLLLLNAGLIARAAQPSVDSAVFLYIGQHIAAGGAPYRDVFDHKGPLIYWINALPFYLGLSSLRAIAALETLGLIAGMLALGQLLHNVVGARAAWLAFFAFCGSITWGLSGGNYTEEWALMLACVAVWAALGLERDIWSGAIVGVCTAGALLLRPNEAIFGFVLIGVIWRLQPQRRRVFGAAFAAALLVALSLAMLILLRQNALGGAWQQYGLYNLSYLGDSWPDRAHALLKCLGKLVTRSGLLLALWGLISLWPRRAQLDETARALFWFAAWALPLQLLSAGLSGRDYPHYYLALVLPITILCALAARHWQPRRWRAAPVLSVLSVITLVWGAVQIGRGVARMRWHPNTTTENVVAAIKTDSRPDQKIVVWGNMVAYLLLSQRQSATRAIYQTPIFQPSFPLGAQYRREFFAQIETEKPVVIVDAAPVIGDTVPVSAVPQLEILLKQHYRVAKQIPDKSGAVVTVWVRNSP